MRAAVAMAEQCYLMYDGSAGGVQGWRVVVVFRDEDATPKESFVYHAAGNAGQGSSSYIDSVILRDRDVTNGWTGAADGTLEERRYYGQNWRADVVAMTKSNGDPLEYVFYSPYGEPIVHPVADIDMDGDVDISWAFTDANLEVANQPRTVASCPRVAGTRPWLR